MTVSSVQRSGLSRAVSRLRVLFEDDYADVLEGTFGIHVSGRRAGEIEDPDSLSLSAHQLAARAELVGVVEYLQGEGLDAMGAVERLLREATFTTVNRLLAVRVAEAIAVLPPSLVEGRSSLGFVEALEMFPLLRDADSSGGYWSYLQVCGDELSHAVPRLFDRRHPLSVLEPSSETLDAAVEILSVEDLEGVWVEPEALGWSYQFFNTQEERLAARGKSDPLSIAVQTQFFTPGYVVDFLVENTLGRRLRESGFGLELPLLLDETDEDAPPLDLDDVSVLDPAVGSGHFLLGAYDLLERAWREQGIEPVEAAPRILGSLFGVDIDARAAQVAQAALYLRARRSAPDGVLDPPRIVTARALPKDPDVWDAVLLDAPSAVRDVVEGLDEVLGQADVLGSLLKPEEYLRDAIGARIGTPQLGDDELGSFEDVEAMVLDAAGRIASQVAATPAERLFAADAADALRFVEIMTRRYDTVLMNPPFGAPPSKAFARIKMGYTSSSKDLFAAFAQRGLEVLAPGGSVGSLGARSGFFLVSFEQWREDCVFPHLRTAADLGFGVAEDAIVELVAFTLDQRRCLRDVHFRSVLREMDKEAGIRDPSRGSRYRRNAGDFLEIPRKPMAYWATDGLISLFQSLPSIDPAGASVESGAATKSDFRFVRLWWEVAPTSVGSRWFSFAKGGEYSPAYTNVHLVVDWEDDARRIAEYVTERYPYLKGNPEWVLHRSSSHFTAGLSWSVVTTSAFGAHALPRGSVFGHAGNGIFPKPEVERAHLGAVLSSRLARYLLQLMLSGGEQTRSGTPVSKYEVGVVQSLPWVKPSDAVAENWADLAVAMRMLRGSGSEDTLAFVVAEDPAPSGVLADLIDLSKSVDDGVARSYGLSRLDEIEVSRDQGPHPGSYPHGEIVDLDDLRDLWRSSTSELVAEAMARTGGARYLATKSFYVDRRLELISHTLKVHPRRITDLIDELSLVRDEDLIASASDRLSYVVGSVFGRWDVRVGRDPSLAPELRDPFDPLPVCPPGMLTGDDGLPVAEAPAGYPISLPPDRILVDDPGHEWDIVRLMESVAEFLFDDPDGELREALGHLKAKDLRAYLRSKFFSQHLKRYSKSRRKAPIYWYLAVPSKEWGLWVYAPWLSREQLFAVARAAQDKMRRLSDEASQLRRDVEAGGGRADRERLEAVEVLLDEVEEFHRVADSVAQSGWEPDLNDGIILNAVPLQELFADKKWRTDIEKHRRKMINGDYPWATVQTSYYDRIES